MILPTGYMTLHEAVEFLLPFKFAGQPDRVEVTRERSKGSDVSDGKAMNGIIDEIRSAVERGQLAAVAIGGYPRVIVRLPADFTKSIPMLWSAKGSFTFVRPNKPAHAELIGWFGSHLSGAALAFEELQIRKFGQRLKRRAKHGKASGPGRRGRPSVIPDVKRIIRVIVDEQKWHPLNGLKALAGQVNRSRPSLAPYSRDTIISALDDLHKETTDRRFERARRNARRS